MPCFLKPRLLEGNHTSTPPLATLRTIPLFLIVVVQRRHHNKYPWTGMCRTSQRPRLPACIPLPNLSVRSSTQQVRRAVLGPIRASLQLLQRMTCYTPVVSQVSSSSISTRTCSCGVPEEGQLCEALNVQRQRNPCNLVEFERELSCLRSVHVCI